MQNAQFPDCFYRVSVKGLCVRDNALLLVRESSELTGKWELPGGGLDFGESIRDGLEREVEEEMGLDVTWVSEQPIYTWTHYFKKRRGFDWFYSLVIGYQVEFAHLDFTPTKECQEIGFFSIDELQTLDLHSQSQKLRSLFDPTDFRTL